MRLLQPAAAPIARKSNSAGRRIMKERPDRNMIYLMMLMFSALGPGFSAGSREHPPLQRLSFQADHHACTVWARIPATPRGTMLLLHGRTWSSRPDFDLQVPGLNRSVLASLAAHGIAAYALDQRGYGATPRDETGWLTPKRAAADASAALAWIAARHPGLPPPALLGWSLGAATSHLAAATAPERMSALVLYGYAPDPDASIAPIQPPPQPLRQKNTREAAASDFISPQVTEAAVIRAFVAEALRTDPVHVDWKMEEQFLCDSSRIRVPTLLLAGARDPNVAAPHLAKFFERLGTKQKQTVSFLPADHCAHLENTHDAWIAAVVNFLDRFAIRHPPAGIR